MKANCTIYDIIWSSRRFLHNVLNIHLNYHEVNHLLNSISFLSFKTFQVNIGLHELANRLLKSNILLMIKCLISFTVHFHTSIWSFFFPNQSKIYIFQVFFKIIFITSIRFSYHFLLAYSLDFTHPFNNKSILRMDSVIL